MIEPEPADVPVNMTEQVPDERIQLAALSEPPVEPAVKVKVTVPAGVFDAVVVSVTVAVTEAVQLVPANGMLQLTFGTVVEVLSFKVEVTNTTVAGALLPL